MKKTKFTLLIPVVIIGVVFVCWSLLPYSERWLLIDGKTAESYAKQLLASGPKTKTPDSLIDYLIVVEKGTVVFSRHDSEHLVMAYSLRGTPAVSDMGTVVWKKVRNSWYFTDLDQPVISANNSR